MRERIEILTLGCLQISSTAFMHFWYKSFTLFRCSSHNENKSLKHSTQAGGGRGYGYASTTIGTSINAIIINTNFLTKVATMTSLTLLKFHLSKVRYNESNFLKKWSVSVIYPFFCYKLGEGD